MSYLRTDLAAFVILTSLVSSGMAQGVVPGGWAQQFGYQTLGGPGIAGGMTFSYGTPGFGAALSPYGAVSPGFGASSPYLVGFGAYGQGFAPYGLGAVRPTYPGNLYGYGAGSGVTVNAMDPLIGAIRQSVRSSRHR